MKLQKYPLKNLLLLICLLINAYLIGAQTVQITANPNSSGNIVIGTFNYHVSETIYTEAEIGVLNFTTLSTAINRIDFNIAALGTPAIVNNFNIYLRNVPLTSTTYTAGIYNTTGYTQVFGGTFNANAIGWVGVDLTTSFIRTSGSNLEVLIERLDNVAHSSFSFRSANGNETGAAVVSSRRNNTNTLPVSGTTILNSTSAYRPQLQLKHATPNDASIVQLYTLGKLPIPFATPHIISANILNNGSAVLNNVAVTLNITGANLFNDVQTIASLAPGASTTVSFTAFNPTNIGTNNVAVTLPNDDFNSNNSKTVAQLITGNSYTYAYSTTPSNAVGLNANTGDFVAKFTTSTPTTINQVGVNFTSSGLPFKIGIWDKSGTGLPGALIWESAVQTTTIGVFTLPVNPFVAVTDTFYVGVRQIGTTNIQFAYQDETPIRPNTFFYTAPTGSTTWTDFAPGNPYKFMIEPRLTLANDVGIATITNPISTSSIDNCGLQPQAIVTNFGSNDQIVPFNVTFAIKQAGAIVFTDTKQIFLNSGESKAIDFATFVGSVSGNDSSFCFTSLASDAAANNDTLVNTFTTNNFSYSGATINSGGYQFANSTDCAIASSFKPTYNWIDETSNEINWGANGDDSVLATPIILPFTFPYFGGNYTQFWISSNGWISFSNPSLLTTAQQRTPISITTAGGVENYIAAMHTDLDITTATYNDARTFYGGNATQFIITFRHAHAFGSATDYISFQIILQPDGNIFIQYNPTETSTPLPTLLTNNCGIGIENTNGTLGMQYRFNGNLGSVFGSPLALQFKPPVPVPVLLYSFLAKNNTGKNYIEWVATEEINVKKYMVEKSKDGRNFEPLTTVLASSINTIRQAYSVTDLLPNTPITFYRLKIIDTDNSFKYSKIISVISSNASGLSIYPNPAKDFFTIKMESATAGLYTLALIDVNGKSFINKRLQILTENTSLHIDCKKIPVGTYVIKLINGTNTITKKITIIK
jgi:Secretion system C-terminal sorting domain